MSTNCDKCNSKRLVSIVSKSSDCNSMWVGHISYLHIGYLLPDLGIGDDEYYISFAYCLDCGKIQGDFPISDDVVKDVLYKNGCNRDGN